MTPEDDALRIIRGEGLPRSRELQEFIASELRSAERRGWERAVAHIAWDQDADRADFVRAYPFHEEPKP